MSEPCDATSIVAWIGQTVERYGNSVAATGVGETLTFEELWSRSLRLARELVARGVEPEDRVGIWAEQSSDLLVGFVGIMAAGAAYVPLDPSYPRGRLERIAADAGMSLIVVPHRHREGAAELGVELVPTTFEDADPAAAVDLPHVGAHHAAYVMFTSGSTGRPKGVVIEHHSLKSLLTWLIADCDLRPGDRVMGTASPAYDASVPTFFLPLVTGGTLISLPAEVTVDPYALADAIAHYRPRALQASPTMLQMLTETGWSGDQRLEIWTGGEQTAASAIRYVAPRVRELYNYYGPTEATVQISVARLKAEDTDAPVGIPPEHVQCFVLDPDGRTVPDGTTGELFIAGPTLARGYLDRPELTAERFCLLSIDGAPPLRAYRTGDLAKFRDDGNLVILGRLDDQIKIRGYLIEPREVEVRLMEHPQIHDAVVIASKRGEDEKRLVAYIKSDGAPSARSVRAFVRQTLPDHMVPTTILEVASFPLTPNGKVDRRMLAEQSSAAASSPTAPKGDAPEPGSPSTPETEVLELFASALSVPADTLDVDDDFFDVGGTSLRCARLFLSIEARYGLALPLSTLVDAPTPRLLSKVIAAEAEGGGTPRAGADPPRHEWERILGNLWSEILMIQDVQRTDSFFAIGGSTDDARRMLDKLRAVEGVDVNLDELRRAPTIVQLAALIGTRSVRSSLVPLKTTGTNPPLFCIAGAGGLAVTFTPLARLLGPEQPFYALQAKGIERRGIPDYTLKGTARRYARLIRDVQPTGPYLIGGHSLGGAIALKVVHLLEAAGEEVALLAVFDSALSEGMVGPSRPVAKESGRGAGRLSDLPRRPRVKTILRLPMVGIVPQHGVAQFEVFAALGQLQVAFARRLEPWDGNAVVFVSDDEHSDSVEAGWRKLLTGEWSSVSVPGQHISMLEKSNIAVAAIHLREQISEVLDADRGDRRDTSRTTAEDAGGAGASGSR
ncbi:MAG TPA: amino acid adenylation domain-containing protein [Acidimicrobiales bacterium]|nr:amino acid adenylation domain-containing protein [Acidimicrobiales bacterium]